MPVLQWEVFWAQNGYGILEAAVLLEIVQMLSLIWLMAKVLSSHNKKPIERRATWKDYYQD